MLKLTPFTNKTKTLLKQIDTIKSMIEHNMWTRGTVSLGESCQTEQKFCMVGMIRVANRMKGILPYCQTHIEFSNTPELEKELNKYLADHPVRDCTGHYHHMIHHVNDGCLDSADDWLPILEAFENHLIEGDINNG